jgi:hypothetical protein
MRANCSSSTHRARRIGQQHDRAEARREIAAAPRPRGMGTMAVVQHAPDVADERVISGAISPRPPIRIGKIRHGVAVACAPMGERSMGAIQPAGGTESPARTIFSSALFGRLERILAHRARLAEQIALAEIDAVIEQLDDRSSRSPRARRSGSGRGARAAS